MQVTIVVSGKSELEYVKAILDQGHAWATLGAYGLDVLSADGDSKLPATITTTIGKGGRAIVLLDRDALERAREQATTIQREDVPVLTLSSDFEGAFDARVVQLALSTLGYQAKIGCLDQAIQSRTPFNGFVGCAQAGDAPVPLSKARLAEALGQVSRQYWYFPLEFDPLFDAAGQMYRLDRNAPSKLFGWAAELKSIEAEGRLYVCNHVSNDRIRGWDFTQRESIEIPLPEKFDGRLAACRHGQRFVAIKHERAANKMFPTSTWIHVLDLKGQILETVFRFRVSGSVYEVLAEEDGNHLQLCIQEENTKYALRCLTDGTQQKGIECTAGADMYGARQSRSGRLRASGPQPMRVERTGTEIGAFPHMYSHSYVWSPRERFLAFFARRWKEPPDFLWLYDLESDQVHRLAAGEAFIPIYWT